MIERLMYGAEKYASSQHLLSWVPRLNISRKLYDKRSPTGAKCIAFYKSFEERFASYSEYSRWDGLIWRLTTFEDEERMVQQVKYLSK